MMMTRVASSLVIASGVTFGLFFLMQGLVTFRDDVNLAEDKQLRFIDVVEDIPEIKPESIDRKVEKPPEIEEVPEQVEVQVETSGPTNNDLGIGRASLGGGVDLGAIDLGPSTDGDYLPLVRVQPQYPRRAQERGVEGYVIVELTVNEDGTVPEESIIVIEADPQGYFETAAKKAAVKFKYKPKVVNGKPQKVTGVRYRFTFDLAEE